MKPLLLIGRILFGGFFLYNGINHFRQHDARLLAGGGPRPADGRSHQFFEEPCPSLGCPGLDGNEGALAGERSCSTPHRKSGPPARRSSRGLNLCSREAGMAGIVNGFEASPSTRRR